MCDSVSEFQAEVAAVMELLLKAAVAEISKVFQRRVCRCTTEDCLPDLRAFTQRTVRCVEVQTADTGLELQDRKTIEEAPGVGEGLPPTEDPCLAFVETVDVQCTVDLPFNVFKEKVVKGEREDDSTLQTSGLEDQTELATEETGFHVLCESLPSLFSADTSSADLAPSSLHQSAVLMKEVDSVDPVLNLVKEELPAAAVNRGEHSRASADESPAADRGFNDRIVRFQLSQSSIDSKLLKPCSVQLVNLLLISSAKVPPPPPGFSVPKDLRTHQHVHTGRRLCCFTELENGVWRLQGSSRRRSHGCKVCGKKFDRKKMLKRHERYHSGEKPYSCGRCGKMFTVRKSLRRHERFHTGERPHHCPQCGKSFCLKENLRAHLRFHTGEKPYTCHLCSRGFRIRKNLHKHILLHSMPGRFK